MSANLNIEQAANEALIIFMSEADACDLYLTRYKSAPAGRDVLCGLASAMPKHSRTSLT
jgi:hypothetical protein